MTKFIVRIPISGTRNGEPWPPPGEQIELPDHEAVDYLNARYVVPMPDEPARAAVVADPAPVTTRGKARAPRRPIKASQKDKPAVVADPAPVTAPGGSKEPPGGKSGESGKE